MSRVTPEPSLEIMPIGDVAANLRGIAEDERKALALMLETHGLITHACDRAFIQRRTEDRIAALEWALRVAEAFAASAHLELLRRSEQHKGKPQ